MALSPGSLDIVLKTDPLSGTSTLMLVAGLNDLTPPTAVGFLRTQTIEVSGNTYYNGEIYITGTNVTSPTPVPEPNSLILLGIGVTAIMGLEVRKRRPEAKRSTYAPTRSLAKQPCSAALTLATLRLA